MKMVKGTFSRKMNKLNDEKGHLWQRRFYDEIIRSEQQLYKQLEYMHQNPVVANLVKSAEQYPYSSFQQYHQSSNENEILQIDPIE